MRLAFLLTTIVIAPPALAGQCPWDKVEDVRTTISSVTINGERFDARGPRRRSKLEATFEDCGSRRASHEFQEWQRQRRLTNTWIAVGLTIFWPALIAPAITGPAAAEARRAMERELERLGEPQA